MKKALVVLSGGQDSTTCLAMCMALLHAGRLEAIAAVTFDYGQRHARELEAARDVAALCGITEHEIVQVGPILAGTSPLTNRAEVLEQYQDFSSMEATIGDRVEKTFVPMRNSLFLTLAANRAVVQGCDLLVTGVCEADNANYPDCRESFIEAQQKAINEALGFAPAQPGYLTIWAPLMHASKADSIRMLLDLGLNAFALLAFSHTAYDGKYPPTGHDHATLLRAEGFLQAHKPDPLVVRAVMESTMLLPETSNYAAGGAAAGEMGQLPNAIMKHKQRLFDISRRKWNAEVAAKKAVQ